MGEDGVSCVELEKIRRALLWRAVDEMERRYNDRDPRYVYVHEVLQPLPLLPSLRRAAQRRLSDVGHLIVGEALERGLRSLLGAVTPPRKCRRLPVEPGGEALETLRRAGVGEHAVCGQTDLLLNIDGERVLVELKTTRITSGIVERRRSWLIQAGLYSWLYESPVVLLVLSFNADDQFKLFKVVSSESWAARVFEKWFSLDPFIPSTYPLPEVVVGGD